MKAIYWSPGVMVTSLMKQKVPQTRMKTMEIITIMITIMQATTMKRPWVM